MDSAGNGDSSKRRPCGRLGGFRAKVRGVSGFVRLIDPGGERTSRLRSSLVGEAVGEAVKKSGIRLGCINRRQVRMGNASIAVEGTHYLTGGGG